MESEMGNQPVKPTATQSSSPACRALRAAGLTLLAFALPFAAALLRGRLSIGDGPTFPMLLGMFVLTFAAYRSGKLWFLVIAPLLGLGIAFADDWPRPDLCAWSAIRIRTAVLFPIWGCLMAWSLLTAFPRSRTNYLLGMAAILGDLLGNCAGHEISAWYLTVARHISFLEHCAWRAVPYACSVLPIMFFQPAPRNSRAASNNVKTMNDPKRVFFCRVAAISAPMLVLTGAATLHLRKMQWEILPRDLLREGREELLAELLWEDQSEKNPSALSSDFWAPGVRVDEMAARAGWRFGERGCPQGAGYRYVLSDLHLSLDGFDCARRVGFVLYNVRQLLGVTPPCLIPTAAPDGGSVDVLQTSSGSWILGRPWREAGDLILVVPCSHPFGNVERVVMIATAWEDYRAFRNDALGEAVTSGWRSRCREAHLTQIDHLVDQFLDDVESMRNGPHSRK